jgi:nucleotide-binding universal stress UspA family protein
MKSIVVPLDGSAFSLQALPAALGITGRSDGSLHLLYVQPVPAPVFEARHAAETTAAVERRLQDLAGTLRTRGDLAVTVVVRQGRPAEVIAAYASESGADLIALTTHARGGLSRLWLGSVADELLRASEIPVLAIRPTRRGAAGARPRRFRQVLVPLDGSELAERALAPLVGMIEGSGARVTVLRVITPHRTIARPAPVTRIDTADLDRQRREAEDYLKGVVARLQRNGIRASWRVVAGPDPARAIIRAAAAADVIAMTTHGQGRVARFLRGSVCDKVLRGATRAAMLITRPGGA